MSWARFCGTFLVLLEEGSLPVLSGGTFWGSGFVLMWEPAATGGHWALELWLGQGRGSFEYWAVVIS